MSSKKYSPYLSRDKIAFRPIRPNPLSSSSFSSIVTRKPPRPLNGYIIFTKFYKESLEKEYPNLSPQERMKKAGEIWNSLRNDLKSSFIKYAEDERILRDFRNSNPIPAATSNNSDAQYDKIFDRYINYPVDEQHDSSSIEQCNQIFSITNYTKIHYASK